MRFSVFQHFRFSAFICLLLFAALAAATHYLCMGGRFWTGWDDAFITYRFAENAVHGHWFVWNLGEPPVYAFTSLSWFALLLPFAALGLSLPAVSLILGFLFHGLAAHLATRFPPFTGGQKGGSGFILHPSSFILCCDWYSGWATTGLETWLFISLIFAAVIAYQREHLNLCALLCALLVWTRPDGIILPALIFLHRALQGRILVRPSLVFAICIMPAIAIPWILTGSPLPFSMAAKSAHVSLGLMNPLNPDNLYTNVGWWPFALFAFGLLVLYQQHRRLILHPSSFILFFFALANFAAYWIFGLPGFCWYYVPILACLIPLACARLPISSLKFQVSSFRLHILLLAVIIFGSLQLSCRTAWLGPQITRGNFAAYHQIAKDVPIGATIASMNVGILGYELSLRSRGDARRASHIYDLQALTSPDLLPALRRSDIDAMLDLKKPDYVIADAQDGAAGTMTRMLATSRRLNPDSYQQVHAYIAPRQILFLLRRIGIPLHLQRPSVARFDAPFCSTRIQP